MKNNKIYTIQGTINDSNSCWILNGDIEMDTNNKEVYIIDTIEGEKSELVENMPIVVQEFIKNNKKLRVK
ncbi:PENCW Pc13g06720 protein [Clostridium botulinum B str. Osaka05]|uniref:PENCW Pc13g06720 protein n=1 Tax=Clostridium botulinum B str. Osaka05 TaxID=1407017 RepID=A0A060N3A3_CLOBO|nr:hypothetical protein [Clostridium botulinum]BAO04966.1 PENCW Pc13g06720 protein [Clostridium botulinum B str. Osaka05]